MNRRTTPAERRRASLALRLSSLEALEPRNLATESLGILTAGIGVATSALVARPESQASASPPTARAITSPTFWSTPSPKRETPAPPPASQPAAPVAIPTVADLPSVSIPEPNLITVAREPETPTTSQGGGGSLGSSHGGSGGVAPAPVANIVNPAEASAAAPYLNLPNVVGSSLTTRQSGTTALPSHGSVARTDALPGIGGGSLLKSGGGGVAMSSLSFSYFPLYTLDYNAGSVLLPGTTRLATLGGKVDLRAQVRDAAVASYSWNTSGLTNATAITGTSTGRLQFRWNTSASVATTNSVSLTVTDTSSHSQTQTYTFQVPAGSGATAGTGTATWPESFAPDHQADAGSSSTAITLPSYNPNVPAVVLAYDSLAADPRPIVQESHLLNASLSVPTTVTAQLTFNGTAGSTFTYDTSQFNAGDIQKIALQANATTLATGRYGYSIALGDVRGSTTTSTATGTATVVNHASAAFGAGWTLAGLERIVPVTGGVVLDLGLGAESRWFAAGSGSTYVSPAGEFSTLVANSGGTYTRTLTDGTVIRYDSSGREVATVDLHNVAITYTYDGSGRLSTIRDYYGNATTFGYDNTSGLLATVSDPANRVATFAHSGTQLSGVVLPDNSSWGYLYDSSNRLTRVTDPNSHGTTFSYDPAGRVGTITYADGASATLMSGQTRGFVPAGSGTATSPAAATLLAEAATVRTDPLGNSTTSWSDWRGLALVNVALDPTGATSSANRDGNGLATITVDPLNRITQAAYDSKGNVTKTIFPDGGSASATYNSTSRPLTVSDELLRTTTAIYDGASNRTGVIDPSGIQSTMTYSGTGRLLSNSNPQASSGGFDGGLGGGVGSPETPGGGSGGGGPITFAYDGQDRMVSLTDGLNDVTTYGYDAAGNRTTIEDANGHVTSATYDALGRVLTVTDALNHTTSYGYDAAGNQTSITDPLGHTTSYSYDARNRLVTTTDARGGVTTQAFDAAGRLSSITDSVGNQTTYAYDAAGRQVGTTDPLGHRTTLTLDPAGQLVGKVDRNSRHTSFSYDPRGRQVSERWLDASLNVIRAITHVYDAAGQLGSVSDGATLLSYTYDSSGRTVTASTSGSTAQPAVTLSMTYRDSGQRASVADNLSAAGQTTYTYDAGFRLSTIESSASGTSQTIQFGYDAGNRLTGLSRKTGTGSGASAVVSTVYTYDAADRVTAIDHQLAGSGTSLASYTYGYDAADRLSAETNAEGSVTYTYDSTDQLTGVSGSRAESYSYDANGNRTMSGYTTGGNNQLSAGAGATYTYDAEGNLTGKTETSSGNAWTYTWDYRNRLTGVVRESSSHSLLMRGTYTYDPLDRRTGVEETVTGGSSSQTWTIYDGQNTYADFDGSGNLQNRYLYGPAVDMLLARTSAAGTSAWYLTDKLGSVRDLVSTSGTLIDHVSYDSYGSVTSESSPSNGDRFKFAAREFDATINLYYQRARWYDSSTGRFISEDPIGFLAGDANLHRYVENDVLNTIDPSGLAPPTNPIVRNSRGVIKEYPVNVAMKGAWLASNPKQGKPIEQGGWIYWNPQNGGYVTRPADPSTTPNPNPNSNNGPGEWIDLTNPPDLSDQGFMLIGKFHTHPFKGRKELSDSDKRSKIHGISYPSYIIYAPNGVHYIPPNSDTYSSGLYLD